MCKQMIMLEGAKATTETVDALRTGASAMKAMQKATYVFIYLTVLLLGSIYYGFKQRLSVRLNTFFLQKH